MNILFVNHNETQCGVYEFGRNIGQALEKSSTKYTFLYRECNSDIELQAIIKQEKPALIIYNVIYPVTMPWLNASVTKKIKCPQVGIIHEVTQQIADQADNSLFNFHIAHDPTVLLKNPIVYKAGRLIPPYKNKYKPPSIPTIGSFGFGFEHKGFEKLVEAVQNEFDEAIIRFNIPFATFGDPDGKSAKQVAENCRKLLVKSNINLHISHDFLDQEDILDFIAQNTINIFLYQGLGEGRGLSSTVDLALAVNRPIAVSSNLMFRHLFETRPSVVLSNSSIKQIIENGLAPLQKFYQVWSEDMLRWDYERITDSILAYNNVPKIEADNRIIRNLKRVKRGIKRRLSKLPVEETSWISDTSIRRFNPVNSKNETYLPVTIPDNWSLNNILDNKARELYQGTINQMFNYLPDLMVRKIPEANVQQAFVLDTVYKIISKIENPKTLCVGSFEDSASESLKNLGFSVEEVDPMINYDLDTFITKPTTIKNSYDVVFSTSVIEHVEYDEKFLIQIAALLKKGGIAVLTCDYCDTYKKGDPIPNVDYRFYTQKDIKKRLLPNLPDCRLVDKPQWDCPNPDFYYGGFNYTFGTIVFKKD